MPLDKKNIYYAIFEINLNLILTIVDAVDYKKVVFVLVFTKITGLLIQ